MKPAASLIVAIYNVAPYLEQCIESIIKQTETNTEVILVDDGSTDNSPEICDKYANMYSHVSVIHQVNAGVSAARNAGIIAATADWIAFIDGDDFLDKNFVSKMLSYTKDDVDIVCCAYNTYNEGEIREKKFFTNEFLYKNLEEKKPLFYQLMQSHYGQEEQFKGTGIGVPWAKLYRASMVKSMRYNTNLRRMQDNVFNMHAFYNARGIRYIIEGLYFYRVNNISTYRRACYEPEIYERVLNERDAFYCKETLFSESEFMEHRLQEKGEYLYKSCKNIVMTSGNFENARARLNGMRDLSVYSEILKDEYEAKSITRRMVVFSWKHRKYRILYYGLGSYWKIKK